MTRANSIRHGHEASTACDTGDASGNETCSTGGEPHSTPGRDAPSRLRVATDGGMPDSQQSTRQRGVIGRFFSWYITALKQYFIGIVVALPLALAGGFAFGFVTITLDIMIGAFGFVPFLLAGLGMGYVVRDGGTRISGVYTALFGVFGYLVGYAYIEGNLPEHLTYQFGFVDVLAILVGVGVAYKLGSDGIDELDL